VIYIKGVGPAFSLKDVNDSFDAGWKARGELIDYGNLQEARANSALLKTFYDAVVSQDLPIDDVEKPR
jgi:hypothetical protein